MSKNERIKEGLNTIGNIVKTGFAIAASFVGIMLLGKCSTMDIVEVMDETERYDYTRRYRYCDVIESIMNSSMLSSDKKRATSLVHKGEVSEYYEAIIAVIDSSMLSSDKIKTIEEINN